MQLYFNFISTHLIASANLFFFFANLPLSDFRYPTPPLPPLSIYKSHSPEDSTAQVSLFVSLVFILFLSNPRPSFHFSDSKAEDIRLAVIFPNRVSSHVVGFFQCTDSEKSFLWCVSRAGSFCEKSQEGGEVD